MAWSVLQSASGSTSGNTVSATFSTANVQAGNKIIAVVSVGATGAPAVTSVKDGAGNTWTQAGTGAQANARSYIFFLDVPAGDVGTKPTLTATSSSTPGLGIEILEVSGLLAGNTTAVLDGTAASLNGTASSTGSPAYTSTAANEFLISAYGDFGTGFTVVTAGGWTAGASNVNSSTNSNCLLQYKNSTNGAETDGFTTADTGGWAVVEVAFQLAAATPSAWVQPQVPPGRQSPAAWSLLQPAPFPASPVVTPVNGAAPAHLVVARRASARVVWRGVAVPPQVARPVTGRGSVARRAPARAVWRPTSTDTTNLLYGQQPDGLVRRRTAARAVVRGGPAPFPPPSGTAPDHLVVARRAAARGVWRGYVSATTNLLYGNQPGSGLVKRRSAARAVQAGTVSVTVNATPSQTPNGTAPDHLVISRRSAARAVWAGRAVPPLLAEPVTGRGLVARRTPARAVWHPTSTETTNLLAGNQPGGLIKRRTAARAVVRGGPAPFPPPNGTAPDHLVVARRAAARGVWRGVTARTTNLQPGNQPGGLVRRRVPARAVWAGTTVRTVNTVPTVTGTAPDHLVVARRAAARVAWRGVTARTVNAAQPAPAPAMRLVVPRRAASRAVVHGNPAPFPPPSGTVQPAATVPARRHAPARVVWRGGPVPGQPARPATGGLTRRRGSPSRGQWHAGAGQPPAAPGGTPARGGRVVTRRPPSRGQWHGTTTRTTNPLPVAVPAPRGRAGHPRRTAARAVWRGSAGQARLSLRIIFAVTGSRQPWQATGARQTWETGTARQQWQPGDARQTWETGTARQQWQPGQARNSG